MSPSIHTSCGHPNEVFTPPPLDRQLSVPQIFDWHYLHNPDHPVFVHAHRADAGQIPALNQITFKTVVPAAHCAGHLVAERCGFDLNNDCRTYGTVAMLAIADTITTFTTIVGMMRAGITVFPISPRFSPPVIAHLLAKNGVSHVLVSPEQHLQELAKEAIYEVVHYYPKCEPQIIAMLEYSDLYANSNYIALPIAPTNFAGFGFCESEVAFEQLPKRHWDLDGVAMIIHSSCSTSQYPKSIRWTHRIALQNTMAPLHSKESLCGQIIGCHGIELFHTLGLLFLLFSTTGGITLATFPPQSPAVLQTPEAVFEGYKATNPAYALANPRFIQEWANDDTKVNFLATMKGLIFGGKLLASAVGNRLSERVKLLPSYGSTEAGQISAFLSERTSGSDWEYFQINPSCSTYFEPLSDTLSRLYLLQTPSQALSCVNASIDGIPAYDTGDLLVPHPSRNGFWKVLGRASERIMLSTGEFVCVLQSFHSALVVLTEDQLGQNPRVSSVLLFGQARPRLGALVELKADFAFDPERDTDKLAEFMEYFWYFVAKINVQLPKIAHIHRELIIVAKPSKPFTYTQKNSPRRAAILAEYQSEIDGLYGSPVSDSLYALDTSSTSIPSIVTA
ncbi:hypothetical protein AN958_03545 [Leucoagaricus sp. SymC.cos]|nr:hypothetical protein AN958_03545 [Leucoagaricus sp. SymC.cos]